jgi:PKD repeat protein
MVGTHWGTISGHILYVNNNSTFLSEYNLRSMVTAEGSGGSHIRTHDHITPANWQGIGCDWDYGGGGGDDLFTTLVYTGPGTGRGVIYTYDPAFYQEEGTVVFERALRYITGSNPQESFPSGRVAFLAANYTSSTTLTAREQAAIGQLTDKGYAIIVVPNYNRSFTDFSAACFVTQAEYFGFLQTSPYEKILNQTRLLLLGDSGKMVGTHWGTMSGHILYVNNNSAFLSEYTLRTMVTVEGSGGSHIRTSDHVTPANWQGIGCDWDYGSGGGDDSFTCLVYAGPGTGRGAIVTYDPDSLTAEDGRQLLHSAVEYTAANQTPAQKPAAAFSADPTSGTAPLAVQFTDLSTGSPTVWNWTFGDGAISTEVHPTHEYTADGNYTVSLTVSNAFGSDTATVADYIRVSSTPTVTGIEKDYETAGSRDPTVRIVRGTGFTGTPEVALVNGSTTIAVANVTVVSPTKLTCTLDLATAPAQKYDVRVTTAGGTGLLRGGFTVFTVPPAMFRADHYRTGAYPDTGADIPNSTRWTFMTGISALSSSPCVSDGVVYVGSYDGNIYAIDAANGAKKWNVTTESEVWSSPCVSDGIVYFGSYGGRFYALDAATGTGKWSSMAVGQNEHSSPCISDGIVCVGGMDGRVHASTPRPGREVGLHDGREHTILTQHQRRHHLHRKRRSESLRDRCRDRDREVGLHDGR